MDGAREGKESLNWRVMAHTENIDQVEGVHGSYHGQAIHGHWCSRGIRNK
jgi:hypothetical protein